MSCSVCYRELKKRHLVDAECGSMPFKVPVWYCQMCVREVMTLETYSKLYELARRTHVLAKEEFSWRDSIFGEFLFRPYGVVYVEKGEDIFTLPFEMDDL